LLLVLDVGNTNTVIGVYHNSELEYHWRIETSRNKTEDEYGMLLRSLFDHAGLMFEQIDGIIISSVILLPGSANRRTGNQDGFKYKI
jgi:type III pantothenate kinase